MLRSDGVKRGFRLHMQCAMNGRNTSDVADAMTASVFAFWPLRCISCACTVLSCKWQGGLRRQWVHRKCTFWLDGNPPPPLSCGELVMKINLLWMFDVSEMCCVCSSWQQQQQQGVITSVIRDTPRWIPLPENWKTMGFNSNHRGPSLFHKGQCAVLNLKCHRSSSLTVFIIENSS